MTDREEAGELIIKVGMLNALDRSERLITSVEQVMELIAIARKRDGWVWVPEEPTKEIEYAWHNGHVSTHQRFRERWRNALAAASVPGKTEADYFQGFKKDLPHPSMPATGTEGRCELCGLRDSPLHDQYEADRTET